MFYVYVQSKYVQVYNHLGYARLMCRYVVMYCTYNNRAWLSAPLFKLLISVLVSPITFGVSSPVLSPTCFLPSTREPQATPPLP